MQKKIELANVLINGDLVVIQMPVLIAKRSIGMYLVYRIIKDQAYFNAIAKTKLKAVQTAYGVKGHIIKVRTIDF